MLLALLDILDMLLRIVTWIIIGQVILSWLLAFRVINPSSDGVRRFIYALEKMTEPIYRPIRRILPDFGGIDFSPMVVLILVAILRRLLAGVAADVAV
ncbi:YggT family protein [Sphingomonas ginkgonis]|uniref:YggT family protein n=1 Tax=Sphingomonas ginkgonis TaxID=2315330 RepID=A0A3R9WM62_9SPHN|nr:YggT family protein [Sphingomonas ginkgonis]RST29677.1 YggT family protein [Sphingomonas ginkgonis]